MVELEILRGNVLKSAEHCCAELGVDLVELTVRWHSETAQIILLADLPNGGIGLDECTKLNRRLDVELCEVLKLGENYTLEVSSPGLDRPLKVASDFRHSVGRKVHLFLHERVQGKMEMIGKIAVVVNGVISLETKTGAVDIALDKIEKAEIVVF